jgi:hypothetical protein
MSRDMPLISVSCKRTEVAKMVIMAAIYVM